MATIALYKNRLNAMPDLVTGLEVSVLFAKVELLGLGMETKSVDRSICDLEDVTSEIKAATELMEGRVEKLDQFHEKLEDFIQDTVDTDQDVADTVNQNKEDFYEEYDYLKPDAEKSDWEVFWEDVGSWCKEHWKAIAAIAIVIVSIVIIVVTAGSALGPIAALLVAMAKGALIGTAIGALSGGVTNAILGGNFWEGVEDGAFNGAVTGFISGGLGHAFSAGGHLAMSGMQIFLNGAISNGAASLLGNIGDTFIKGDDISAWEVVSDFGISFTFGGLFSLIGDSLSNKFNNMFSSIVKGKTTGQGSWSHVWKTQVTRSINHHTRVSWKTFMKGFGADIIDSIGDFFANPFNDLVGGGADMLVGDE